MAVHLYIVATWLLLWAVFYGWGTLACRLGRCDRDDALALLINPWIGFVCVAGVLQIWHLAAPVGTWACGVVCVTGIVAAAAFGLRPLSLIAATVRGMPWQSLLVAVLALWLVNRSTAVARYTDHGLYYLNTIRWVAEYSIVPGLANLHSRLAFNNSSFLVHAMLEAIVGRGHSAHVLNGLLAAMTVPIILYGLRAALSGNPNQRQAGWFTLALAMMAASAAIDGRLPSATPDFPAILLVTIATWRLLIVSTNESEADGPLLRWNLLAIAMLATAGVTIKLFVFFYSLLAGVALALILYRLHRRHTSRPLKATTGSLSFMAVWSMLLFIPWVVRGYVLSGYPFFPSTIAGASVEWKYDPEAAVSLREEVTYAWYHLIGKKYATDFYEGWGWVPEWFVQVALLRAPVEIVLPSLIIAASVVLLGVAALVRRHLASRPSELDVSKQTALSRPWLSACILAAAYGGAIMIWFNTAPSPRFGSFAVWGLAALCIGMVSRIIAVNWTARYRPVIVAATGLMLLLPMLDRAARIELRYRHLPRHPTYGKHFYHYYPFVLPTGAGRFPRVPKADLVRHTTNSGLTVYVSPIEDDGEPRLPWDSPLLSARHFDPDLALRRAGDLNSGFIIARSRSQKEQEDGQQRSLASDGKQTNSAGQRR